MAAIQNNKTKFDFFLSYSHKDKKIVEYAFQKLKDELKIWIDFEQLRVGDNLMMETADAIYEKCERFLCFISNDYLNSYSCVMEIRFAIKSKKIVFIQMEHLNKENEIRLDTWRSKSYGAINYNYDPNTLDEFLDYIKKKDLPDFCNFLSLRNDESSYDVFISYCRNPILEKVKGLVKNLELCRLKVWSDENRLKDRCGNLLAKELMDGINKSRVFICIINEAYCKSNNCLDEFEWAREKNKLIIPIQMEKIGDCEIKFRTRRILRPDFRKVELDDKNSVEFKGLVESIK